MFQSYSDSRLSNAALNIIYLEKYGRKDPKHLLEGEQCGPAGLLIGSEFHSSVAALC